MNNIKTPKIMIQENLKLFNNKTIGGFNQRSQFCIVPAGMASICHTSWEADTKMHLFRASSKTGHIGIVSTL